MQKTNTKKQSTVTIQKTEYEALIHTAEVTSEYLSGKAKKFSAAKLIADLRNL